MTRSFACLREGVGRPILLLPGLQGQPVVFRPLLAVLAPNRPIWGYAFGDGGLQEDIRDVASEAKRAKLDDFDVICGSYGGQVALRCGPVWRTLVLTASFPDFGLLPASAKVRLRASLAMPSPLIERVYSRSFEKRLLEDELPSELAAEMRPPSGRALHSRLRGLLELASVPSPVPLLWLAGERDAQAPWSESEIQRHWPDATVRRLEGKHRPYASHPEEFSRVVQDWWSLIDSGE